MNAPSQFPQLIDSRLGRDIAGQPRSLEAVLRQQSGPGLASMRKAAAILRSARRVVITGMGASMFAAIPLEYALNDQGLDAVVIEAGEYLHYRQQASRDAVLVVVSRSGESIEIARLLESTKGWQTVIGVTNEPTSLLARTSDVCLQVGSFADEMVAIQTYTGTLLALHLLEQAVAGTLEQAVDEMARLIPSFAALTTASLSVLDTWSLFLDCAQPPYLLGRGPSLASIYEGALLFHEVAKSPAVAMPTASFRHGPVEVVDGKFHAFVFAAAGGTRLLNLALSQDIQRFGGSVRVIAQPEKNLDASSWCALPECREGLSPLFEIVPLQVAALCMAGMRGVAPGSFRYTPQVSIDEAHFAVG